MVSSVTARKYTVDDFRSLNVEVLQPSVELWGAERHVGAATIASLSGGPAELDLSRKQEHEEEHVDFIFFDQGQASFLGVEGWTRLEAEVVVSPTRAPHRARFDAPWRVTAVRLPRSAIEGFVPELPSEIGAFERRSCLERAMQAFASALVRGGEHPPSAVESYAIEQLLLEMGGAALLDRLGDGWRRGAPSAVLRDRAIAIIVQQCADPLLTPEFVARATNISLRQLQNVFAAARITVAGEIRRQRARLARSLLLDARYDVLSIEQIAERAGFGTPMSMRRALNDVYGAGPREIRRTR